MAEQPRTFQPNWEDISETIVMCKRQGTVREISRPGAWDLGPGTCSHRVEKLLFWMNQLAAKRELGSQSCAYPAVLIPTGL